MTEQDRVDDRIAALEARLATLETAHAALLAAVNRAADYLGVAHVLKDPRV